MRRFFGSRTETATGALCYAGAITAMTSTQRQQLAEAVLNFRGDFSDPEHRGGSFQWGSYEQPFSVWFEVADDKLTIGATPL
jgi:hypothetical protein